ncbi:hypothetical protein KJA16_03080 [Patescibacteria group bacterium]|nr:hypothetical protein [Patescibacteria group bacterium]
MEKLIIGIIFIGLGLLFFFNNKNISKGASRFYQKLYTEHNLKIMFRAFGVILFLAGLVLIFLK